MYKNSNNNINHQLFFIMNKLFKLFYGFAAMMITALAVSCSSDDLESVGTYDGSTVTVSLNVTAPDALETTRALTGSNSAYGGLSNVDFSDYVLRYQLKIYEVTTSDDETTLSLIENQPDAVPVTSADANATFTATLTTGSTYKFVVWADFVEATSSTDETESTSTTTYPDLHYDTSTGLTSTGWTITCKDGTDAQLNDESRDAYYGCSNEETISSDNASISISCSRPFAKIRLVTTDWEDGKADAVSIQYTGGKRFTNIDLLTGDSESEELSSSSEIYTASIPEDAYADGVDAESGQKTLVVDYLMTDYVDEQTTINFTYTATLNSETVKTLDISTGVPIQRNYLTTITCALLGGTETTEEVTITCSALNDFTDEIVPDDDEEEEDSYTYPESYPESNDYSIGSVVFYSSDSENAGFYSVSADDYTSIYAEYTGLTAIGVVAVPSTITGDNTVRIVALKYGSYSNPDEGSTTAEAMRWGYYRNQSNTDGADCTYYYTSFVEGKTNDENLELVTNNRTIGTSSSSSVSSNNRCYLPRYEYSSWTNSSTSSTYWYYENDGSTYAWAPDPTSTYFSESGYASADYEGRARVKMVLDFLDGYEPASGYTFTENYKTAETLNNSRGEGYYPGVTCCWRYSTTGTNQGDWYLPASGELAFLTLYFTQINDGITAAIGEDTDAGAVMGSTDAYMSSTEKSYTDVWVIDCETGYYFCYGSSTYGASSKDKNVNYVRPFLTLDTSTDTVVNDSSDSTDE